MLRILALTASLTVHLFILHGAACMRPPGRAYHPGPAHATAAGPGCGERNERPIIGVLSQPAVFGEAGESFSVHDIDPSVPSSSTYIAASYVKWIEQTGARVLPIMADDPDDVIERKFRMTNGLLLPGGAVSARNAGIGEDDLYHKAASKVFDMAVAQGGYPIHGTCRGLELLLVLVADDEGIIGNFDHVDKVDKLSWTSQLIFSDLIKEIPLPFLTKASHSAVLYFNHRHGVSADVFEATPALKDGIRMLATSQDTSGSEFVAVVESVDRSMHMSGFQFHPEKSQFEWKDPSNIPHGQDALVLSTMFAFSFVEKARCNSHRPPKAGAEDDMLIYNFTPTYSGQWKTPSGKPFDFEEIYLFYDGHAA